MTISLSMVRLISASILLMVSPLFAQDGTDRMTKLHEGFISRYDEINATANKSKETLQAGYLGALARLQEQLQKTGKIEAVLPLLDEISAAKSGVDPLPALPASANRDLKLLRDKYSASRHAVETKRAKEVVAIVEKMEDALKTQEAELTKAGKFDAALAAKRMRDSLAQDQGIASAKELTAADTAKSNVEGWRSLLEEEMEVKTKNRRQTCVLSKIRPEDNPLGPFVEILKQLKEKPERILMSHAPAMVEFRLAKHATQVHGKIMLANGGGSVRFKIHVGNKCVFEKSIEGEVKTLPFEAQFEPAKLLQLEVDGIDSIDGDWSAWLAPEIR